jgi:hypothetical protein
VRERKERKNAESARETAYTVSCGGNKMKLIEDGNG